MPVLLTIWLVGISLFAWWALFKAIPSNCVSRFRYRLWAIRDAIVAEILDGRYERREAAEQLVREVERTIRVAPELTLMRLFVMRLSRTGITPLPKYKQIDLKRLSGADRKLISEWQEKFARQVFRHAFLGSPSGWIVSALLSSVFGLVRVISLLLRLGRGGPHDDGFIQHTKNQIFEEVDLDFESALPVLDRPYRHRRESALI